MKLLFCSKKKSTHKKGMAMLEALPIIWVMFILMAATLGSWGVVHTAVLHSIAARNYVFFLFNNRSDLSYLRDFSTEYELPSNLAYYDGKRFSFIQAFGVSGDANTVATLRRVDFRAGEYKDDRDGFIADTKHSHLATGSIIGESRNKKKVGPAWIMVGYGICLDAHCGGN